MMAKVKPGLLAPSHVRSPKENTGERIQTVGYPPEGAQRGGHVKGAANIPWAQVANPYQTFKSADELKALYEKKGITPNNDVIAYCRIGERSAPTRSVQTQLLAYFLGARTRAAATSSPPT